MNDSWWCIILIHFKYLWYHMEWIITTSRHLSTFAEILCLTKDWSHRGFDQPQFAAADFSSNKKLGECFALKNHILIYFTYTFYPSLTQLFAHVSRISKIFRPGLLDQTCGPRASVAAEGYHPRRPERGWAGPPGAGAHGFILTSFF